jgi:uncharacterized protein (DUF2141 family)
MKRSYLIPAFLFGLAATALPAAAQGAKVNVEVSNVKNSDGLVLGNLCAEGDGPFPGPCFTHMAMAKAEAGVTLLGFSNVTPGRYTLQAFHDENGNMTPEFPAEGVAFSNNPTGRPTFENASISISGAATIQIKMQYIGGKE